LPVHFEFHFRRWENDGFGLVVFPDAYLIAKNLRYFWVDGLKVAEGSLKDAPLRTGALEDLLEERPEGKQIILICVIF